MIKVCNLSKSYGPIQAVKNLSFEVAKGSIFAFLGTNGAGKSTTIGCMTTVLPFESGTIEIAGRQVGAGSNDVRQRIGVVFQNSLLDSILTVRENIDARAGLYDLDKTQRAARIEELSQLIGLGEFLDRRYGTLSGGQKRRADIARALVHDPELLFLDEPTAGLDPQSREQVWETIHSLQRDQGLTVLLTTHYMEETEQADHVVIIEAGSLVAQGTPTQLRQQYSASVITLSVSDIAAMTAACQSSGKPFTVDKGLVKVEVESHEDALKFLNEYAPIISDFEFRHGRMDDVFLALTGGSTS